MTPERLEEIRALCDAAQGGPWALDGWEDGQYFRCEGINGCAGGVAWVSDPSASLIFGDHADAKFIAASRQIVPELLSEIERLTKALGQAVNRAGLVLESDATNQTLEGARFELRQTLVVWESRPDWAELAAYLREVKP